MTGKFVGYREDFEGYRDDAASAIKALATASSQSTRDELTGDAKNYIEEAERLLRILEVEARGGNTQARQGMQAQVGTFKQQVEKLKSSLERAKLVGGSEQRSAPKKASNPNASQKDELVRTQQQIDRHDDLLYDAQVVVEESADIAINISTNLNTQRQHLTNARDNVDNTHEDAIDAGDHLKSLQRKHSVQIGLLYFLIFGLVVAIISSVVSRF